MRQRARGTSFSLSRCIIEVAVRRQRFRPEDKPVRAPAESFFALLLLKADLVHGRRFRTRAGARSELLEYIEVRYHRKRLHSSLGYRSPVHYETFMAEQHPMAVAA